MLHKQKAARRIVLLAAFGAGMACAQEPAPSLASPGSAPVDGGFYGGVVLRPGAPAGAGVQVGQTAALAWSRFVAPTADEAAPRTVLFGGYRWANDVAVEAAFATVDRYALAPSGRGGVGLALASQPDPLASRAWNADVYTSWSFRSNLALYGRLGYAQAESQLAYLPGGSYLTADPRRGRDGVNYGLGLRYDVTRSLGLRVEYARFGRFAGESFSGALPESDQVQFGMQFRF